MQKYSYIKSEAYLFGSILSEISKEYQKEIYKMTFSHTRAYGKES